MKNIICHCGKTKGKKCFPCAEAEFELLLQRARDGSLFDKREMTDEIKIDYDLLIDTKSGYHHGDVKWDNSSDARIEEEELRRTYRDPAVRAGRVGCGARSGWEMTRTARIRQGYFDSCWEE